MVFFCRIEILQRHDNEVVAFDNEADAENRFSDYVTNDLLDGFDGTAEEFDKERDRLLGCVTEERYMQSRVLNVEINEECYCVTLTRQMI